VACYSVHPLVSEIRERVHPSVHVTGIFEASITTAMAMLPQRWRTYSLLGNDEGYRTFGIVSTGSYWKESLSQGVMEFLGTPGDESECHEFQGVETTGLTAGELHTSNQEDVRHRVKEATKRLVQDHTCSVVCLGCAGMAGKSASRHIIAPSTIVMTFMI
jgi:Asp/Glu/hydantoin racemase